MDLSEIEKLEAPVKVVDPVKKGILDMVEYIENHGWCQKQNHNRLTGGVCIIGALRRIGAPLYVRDQVMDKLVILSHLSPNRNIASWNDVPGRTKEQVTDTLRAIAYGQPLPIYEV